MVADFSIKSFVKLYRVNGVNKNNMSTEIRKLDANIPIVITAPVWKFSEKVIYMMPNQKQNEKLVRAESGEKLDLSENVLPKDVLPWSERNLFKYKIDIGSIKISLIRSTKHVLYSVFFISCPLEALKGALFRRAN